MPAPVPAGADAPRTRTVHALVLEDHPHPGDPGPRRRGLYVDCETTGFDPEHDTVLELAMLPFSYTRTGVITDVHRNQALAGQAIDAAAAGKLVDESHLVIAHNASFDRPFFERIVPATKHAAWACSQHEVPWDPGACSSRSLACLLCGYGAFSPEPHRALADCEAGVWLLTRTLSGTDRTVFAALRETAAKPTVRVWAVDAPFDTNAALKHRGYRWMPHERSGIPCSWWTDLAFCDLEKELAWIVHLFREHGQSLNPNNLPRHTLTARDRWRADPLEGLAVNVDGFARSQAQGQRRPGVRVPPFIR